MGWNRNEALRHEAVGAPAGGGLWEQALARERRRRRATLEMLRAVERFNAASEAGQVLAAIRLGARDLLRGQLAEACWIHGPQDGPRAGALRDPLRLESWCYRARKMLWIENAGALHGIDLPVLENGARATAAIAAPLFRMGRPCGVVAVYFDGPRLFTRTDRRTLLSLIGQAAAALQRVRPPVAPEPAALPYGRPSIRGAAS